MGSTADDDLVASAVRFDGCAVAVAGGLDFRTDPTDLATADYATLTPPANTAPLGTDPDASLAGPGG